MTRSGGSVRSLLIVTLLAAAGSIPTRAQTPTDSLVLRCAALDADGRCSLYDSSVIQLIARPDLFDGKRVRVIGYIHLEFEGNGIYVRREDLVRRIHGNGLWVAFSDAPPDGCQDRYVVIQGIFRARHHGHMGLWSGAITDITRCDPWG